MKTSMVENENIAALLVIIHLLRLPHLFLEIAGRLTHVSKRLDLELAEVGDGISIEGSLPSIFTNPFLQVLPPFGASGIDAARDLERLRIQFKRSQATELVAIRIVEFVVVHLPIGVRGALVALSKNPAEGPSVGLSRLGFNRVAQRLCRLVGIRQIPLIQHEKAAG